MVPSRLRGVDGGPVSPQDLEDRVFTQVSHGHDDGGDDDDDAAVRGGQDRAAQALAARGRHGVCQAAQSVGLPRPQVPYISTYNILQYLALIFIHATSTIVF